MQEGAWPRPHTHTHTRKHTHTHLLDIEEGKWPRPVDLHVYPCRPAPPMPRLLYATFDLSSGLRVEC